MKSPMTVRRLQAKRVIRWVLIIQSILFITIGALALLNPKTVVFNVVIDDDYREHFGVQTHRPTVADVQLSRPPTVEESGSIVSDFLKRVFASPDTSEQEKIAMLQELEVSNQKLAQLHPEQVALTTPTQLYGAVLLYFAIKSLVIRAYTFELTPAFTTDHLVWFACNLVGMVVAAPGRGEGMASTNFVAFMLMVNGCLLVVWLYIRKKIDDIMLLAPREEREKALGVVTLTQETSENDESDQLTDG